MEINPLASFTIGANFSTLFLIWVQTQKLLQSFPFLFCKLGDKLMAMVGSYKVTDDSYSTKRRNKVRNGGKTD